MLTLLRSSLHHLLPFYHYLPLRTFIGPSIPWIRDRALDHAVEKEKNLKPLTSLKTLINSSPSKTLLISSLSNYNSDLSLPTSRVVDFIRSHPAVFTEFLPDGVPINMARPHVKLTDEVLEVEEEEERVFNGDLYRQDVADRLLKLLMLSRLSKIPLEVVDRLRWDLGLPGDYVRSLLTDYPDYFQVTTMARNGTMGVAGERGEGLALELVCWSKELAVSVMEKRAMKQEGGYQKGMYIEFPLSYSRGFDLEKKVKLWLDKWQKLPYVSPYEDMKHLGAKGDQAEHWVVAVLHELLSLLISKKTRKENVLAFGECIGLRKGFQKALTNFPGIFYVSNKIRAQTIVLREGYKRDLLVEKHPLMNLRYRYIHLMNKKKDEDVKPDSGQGKAKVAQQQNVDSNYVAEGEQEGEEDFDESAEDETDDEQYNNGDGEEDGEENMVEYLPKTFAKRATSQAGPPRARWNNVREGVRTQQRRNSNQNSEKTEPLKSMHQSKSRERHSSMNGDRVRTNSSRRTDSLKRFNSSAKSEGIRKPQRSSGTDSSKKRKFDAFGDRSPRASSRKGDTNKGYKAKTSGKSDYPKMPKLATEIRFRS